MDIRYAIGASLVAVIATSSGAASAYVKEGFSNILIGIFSGIATSMGVLTGAFLAAKMPVAAIGVIFGVVLLYSAYHSLNPPPEVAADAQPPDRLSAPENGWHVSRRAWTRHLYGPGYSARVRTYGRRWRNLGLARHWIGSGEGASDGPGYADSV